MASSLFRNQPTNNFQNIKSMMNMVKGAQNPQAMLQSMLMNNPNYSQIMNLINQYGDPKSAFFALAQQKGIDPNQIINMLK